jgi:predicted transcriptional regulator YheO
MQSNGRHRSTEDTSTEDIGSFKKITGKELTSLEEISARLTTLVEMLDEKGIMSKKEYLRTCSMRLHEISKATSFEQLDEEI